MDALSNYDRIYTLGKIDDDGVHFFNRPDANFHYDKAPFYTPILGYKIKLRLTKWKYFKTGILRSDAYGIYFYYSGRGRKTTDYNEHYQVDLPGVVAEIAWCE